MSPETRQQIVAAAVRYLARSNAAESAPPPALADKPQWQEVAEGRPFQLGASYYANGREGIVRDENKAFFFHTAMGVNQYITVDLGETRTIRRLEIGNRRDACYERAGLLFALFHVASAWDDAKVQFIDAPEDFRTGKTLEVAATVPGYAARYVTITSPIETALHFSQLRVFADSAFASSSDSWPGRI